MLEQDICGGGPSGRNGGFASGWWDELDGLVRLYGTEGAVRAAREISKSISGLAEFCSRHGVDAWFQRAGYVFAATGPRHELVCEEMVHAAAEAGAPAEMQALTREQVRKRCSSPAFRSGAFMRDGASVQPALLARGLRRVVLERGVTIHEGTTVTRLDGGPTAVTERGSVRATHAVLAINAWATAWPRIGRRVAAWSSYIVLTEPAPEKLEEIGWTGGELISDLRQSLRYFRTTRDGRIAFGGGGGRAAPRVGDTFTHDRPSSTAGAGRSTSPPPTCRRSGRCRRATCTSPLATQATASRRRTWRAESWPTSPRTPTPTWSTCRW